MKILFRIMLVAFLLNMSFSIKATAQTPTFNFTENHITIDGSIDTEWDNHEAEAIAINNWGTVSSGADLNATYKLTWNDTNLYLLVVVNDDDIHSDNDANRWEDDGIEIYIDINNDKNVEYGANDYHFLFRYNDIVLGEVKHDSTNGVIMNQSATASTITYEVKFPWSTLGLTNPANDVYVGFDAHINDDDAGGARDGKLSWYGTQDNAWQSPSAFGTIQLGGKPSLGKADKPDFSHERGFYNSAFALTITSETNEGTIYYTLDGSDPRTSSSRLSGNSPINVTVNPTNTTNRGGNTPAVVVRAFTAKTGLDNSNIHTCSYIFTNSVKSQGNPGGIWPAPTNAQWGWDKPQYLYYLMNPLVTTSTQYGDSIDDALLDIPSFSIVTDNNNLFNNTNGIYVNANNDGKTWERPVSIELINPDGSDGFQIDAGLRIRGGFSRNPTNPKHSFRVFFRSEYGESKLKFPLFGKEGADVFDKIDFRTSQNYAWSNDANNGDQNTMLKDVAFRDIQGKMGHPYTKSRFYHLYINGMYWGLYQTEERSEARFAETYMGGDKTDYDVVKPERDFPDVNGDDLKVIATDGTMDAFTRLYNKTENGYTTLSNYFEVQGLNTNGTRNNSYERLVDIENLIDYVALTYYSGSYDAPVGQWGTAPQKGNNYFAIFNRNNPDGFKWFVHDFEHSMNNRSNHQREGGVNETWVIDGVTYEAFQDGVEWFNPLMVHIKMLENDEYKIKFADRIFKHYTTGGILSPDSVLAVWNKRQEQIETAIIAESARWGGSKVSTRTKNDDWLDIINYLKTNYFPYRTNIVFQKLKDLGYYPSINPPAFKISGNNIYTSELNSAIGDIIQIINTNGTTGQIYYTTDGSDPRAIGGGVNSSATTGGDAVNVTINTTTILKSRILNGTSWSALEEVRFNVADPLTNLKITEIHYNPLDNPPYEGSELEFIELKNTGTTEINLTGVSFTDGIEYTFESQKLAAGAFIVLASNRTAFIANYGSTPDGEYIGSLNNSGEDLELRNSTGAVILLMDYNDKKPWPVGADGFGNSLVSTETSPSGDPDKNEYWRLSASIGGSPGADDVIPDIEPIIISEVLTHTDHPLVDAIELYNPNSSSVDVSNWFLSDKQNEPTRWRIPSGTSIAANSYIVINEGHYDGSTLTANSNEFGSAFSLSSHGEDLYLISANSNAVFTGYTTSISFGEIETNTSFGTHTNSVGDVHLVAQSSNSLGSVNNTPRIGPLVFSEIMYNPDAYNYEYIEITNITTGTVNLWASDNTANTWKIGGIDFNFPTGTSLAAGAKLYIIESGITAAAFRLKYGLASGVQVFNMTGSIDNGGETISIKRPAPEYIKDFETKFEYILVEAVKFNDKSPWPIDADGNGASLVRINNSTYGNDPANWTKSLEAAPALTADATDNNIFNDIDITFSDNTEWRSAITALKIDDNTIQSSKYTITAGRITITKDVFRTEGTFEISVLADRHTNTTVNQFIMGMGDAPTLTADISDNFINEEIEILFTDDASWRSDITEILVNNDQINADKYTVSNGKLTFIEGTFPTDFTYNIIINADGYLSTSVAQIVRPYELAPTLIADNTNNYTGKLIEVTFTDSELWRDHVTGVSVNNIELESNQYAISAGKIILHTSVFEQAGDYRVKVSASFHQEASVIQEIENEFSGIEESIAELNIKVYPNPSNGIFHIDMGTVLKEYDYTVYTLHGQMVNLGTINAAEQSINLSDFERGIYILSISDAHTQGTFRLSKQ